MPDKANSLHLMNKPGKYKGSFEKYHGNVSTFKDEALIRPRKSMSGPNSLHASNMSGPKLMPDKTGLNMFPIKPRKASGDKGNTLNAPFGDSGGRFPSKGMSKITSG